MWVYHNHPGYSFSCNTCRALYIDYEGGKNEVIGCEHRSGIRPYWLGTRLKFWSAPAAFHYFNVKWIPLLLPVPNAAYSSKMSISSSIDLWLSSVGMY